jgi:tetratricopeptide (TPR) repeat protein
MMTPRGLSVIMPRMPTTARLLALLLSISFVAAPAAHAQCAGGGDPSSLQQARQLFIDGSADVEAGRWADAIESFERAYALSCAPSALYNLAMALRALGRHREARDAFDRLMSEHPNLTGELQTNTVNYRREEAARVAVLELAGIEPDLRPEISFDGEPYADTGQRPIAIETDAGTHSLVLQIPDYRPFLWEGRLRDGQHETVDVSFTPLPIGEGGVEWWPILVGIGAALLIGAGIGVGVYLWDEQQLDPLQPERRYDL